jgi:hypothetical protein
MVGYSEKQILSYIKRLVKGFNKLPHNYGVAIGFSIIEDDTKLVEDAYNEKMTGAKKVSRRIKYHADHEIYDRGYNAGREIASQKSIEE